MRKIEKIKEQAVEPDFWQATESTEQPAPLSKIEKSQTIESFVEHTDYINKNNFSIHKNEKLMLLDLTKHDKEEIPKLILDNHAGWNVTDGDYTGDTTMDEERSVRYRRTKKRLQKFSFSITIAIVIIMVLALASIVASAISL